MSEQLLISKHNPSLNGASCRLCREPWPCEVSRLQAQVKRLTEELETATKDFVRRVREVKQQRDVANRQLAVVVERLEQIAVYHDHGDLYMADRIRKFLADIPAAAQEIGAKPCETCGGKGRAFGTCEFNVLPHPCQDAGPCPDCGAGLKERAEKLAGLLRREQQLKALGELGHPVGSRACELADDIDSALREEGK